VPVQRLRLVRILLGSAAYIEPFGEDHEAGTVGSGGAGQPLCLVEVAIDVWGALELDRRRAQRASSLLVD
jgi:hypothetical protein